MLSITEARREIPIKEKVDVLVVGGGTAGVPAAIAAAHLGAKTLVVERYGFLGGLVTGGPTGIHTFFNCYHDEEGTANVPEFMKKQLIKGLPQEIVKRLREAGGGLEHVELELSKRFISVLTPVDPEVYKWLAIEMVLESGADVCLHSYVSDVIVEGDVVKGVVLESKSGREAIIAKVTVDCTGVSVNGIDVKEITKASIHLHRQIRNVARFFRDCIPGFENAYLVATGPLLGVRRTRLIEAVFDIPKEYVLKREGAEDEVGRFGFIDMPDYRVENAGSFAIPYRSLIPKEVEGVLIAGRSMSTTPSYITQPEMQVATW